MTTQPDEADVEVVENAIRNELFAVSGFSSAKAARAAIQALDQRRGESVDFYEREFYPLSNFSSFTALWTLSPPRHGFGRFATSEAVYQWEKFNGDDRTERQRIIQEQIHLALSAHEAFKIAEVNREYRRSKWDDEKVDVMRRIIRAKAVQHEYVRRKLLETGDRRLVEGSWRDDFWGTGPNRDGQNMLGKLWEELRADLRSRPLPEQPKE